MIKRTIITKAEDILVAHDNFVKSLKGEVTYTALCSIKGCKLPAESFRTLHMPFCLDHQIMLIKAIEERLCLNEE